MAQSIVPGSYYDLFQVAVVLLDNPSITNVGDVLVKSAEPRECPQCDAPLSEDGTCPWGCFDLSRWRGLDED
ncbi:MAG: hypothetical protein BWY68_00347 [bacterium ADurb.Bin400]|nr:MAG: hypothetical protein BWY68_00347 [bacterium ADurb.Bin400]